MIKQISLIILVFFSFLSSQLSYAQELEKSQIVGFWNRTGGFVNSEEKVNCDIERTGTNYLFNSDSTYLMTRSYGDDITGKWWIEGNSIVLLRDPYKTYNLEVIPKKKTWKVNWKSSDCFYIVNQVEDKGKMYDIYDVFIRN